MPTSVENVKTEFGVRHGLTDDQLNAIEAKALELRRTYEPSATTFNDLIVHQPEVIVQWFVHGHNALAEQAEAEAKLPPKVTPFQLREGALIERIAAGGNTSLTAQRDIIKFYQSELTLTPAAAAQAASRKLAEFGLKLGTDKPAPADFKLPKPIRKALKVAAAAGEIERAPKMVRLDRPEDLKSQSRNPYLLPLDDPTRRAKILKVVGHGSLADNLAKAAGCRIDGRKIVTT